MKKALYNPDGSFMSALHPDIDTSAPFVLMPDAEALALTSRHFHENGEWVYRPFPPPTIEQMWEPVRQERNRRLAASDWTQLPDVPLETKSAWTAYRQALRDITEQPDPFNIAWPTPPGG